MKVTSRKNCRCITCKKNFHYLGIARHRAMHRDKKEVCEITYTDGVTYIHDFTPEDENTDIPNTKSVRCKMVGQV